MLLTPGCGAVNRKSRALGMAAVNAPATSSEEEAHANEGLGGARAPLGATGRNGAAAKLMLDPTPWVAEPRS